MPGPVLEDRLGFDRCIHLQTSWRDSTGGKGCRYNGKDFPVEEVPVKDVSGAGDTFIAGLVKGYLDTNNIEKAIIFAQKCTTQVVQKHGVAVVNLGELE